MSVYVQVVLLNKVKVEVGVGGFVVSDGFCFCFLMMILVEMFFFFNCLILFIYVIYFCIDFRVYDVCSCVLF